MRDYALLAKAFRHCGAKKPCGDCPMYGECPDIECRKNAADAIEELLARDVVPMDFHERCLQLEIKKRIELEKQLPHWISVEERLPEEWEPVYAAVRSEGREDWVIEVPVYDPYLTCPWGHIPMIENGKAEVYAWMPRPLPEPPKGVE